MRGISASAVGKQEKGGSRVGWPVTPQTLWQLAANATVCVWTEGFLPECL